METVNHVAELQIDVWFAAAEGKEGLSVAGFGIQERVCNNACNYCLQD